MRAGVQHGMRPRHPSRAPRNDASCAREPDQGRRSIRRVACGAPPRPSDSSVRAALAQVAIARRVGSVEVEVHGRARGRRPAERGHRVARMDALDIRRAARVRTDAHVAQCAVVGKGDLFAGPHRESPAFFDQSARMGQGGTARDEQGEGKTERAGMTREAGQGGCRLREGHDSAMRGRAGAERLKAEGHGPSDGRAAVRGPVPRSPW